LLPRREGVDRPTSQSEASVSRKGSNAYRLLEARWHLRRFAPPETTKHTFAKRSFCFMCELVLYRFCAAYIYQLSISVIFHKAYYLIQRMLRVGSIARYNRNAYRQCLMYVLRIYFRHRRVETLPRLINKASADLSFVLQGSRVSDMKCKLCG